ncbi:hypothetical protein CASFOL_002027 [Castilleja foliolosa]|uniref:Uncharacterized protein n=1 Tax=Castilleja foliolosa TaxID=1961234 RepID=A0ABD3EGN3_9LAMI
MLDSTLELISQAASNPLMVFCFCNLIIAILLVGSSTKPCSTNTEEKSRVGPNDATGKLSSLDTTMVEIKEGPPHEADDDLKRRVEEFIEKINKGWRAEKVKTNLFGANV